MLGLREVGEFFILELFYYSFMKLILENIFLWIKNVNYFSVLINYF